MSAAAFVGRIRELELLESAFESSQSALIPIYGRRRVGKSELILRFMSDKAGVYYLGKQSPAGLQVREFLEEAARALDAPLLAELRSLGWREALLTVVGQWQAVRPGAKLVLVLDEFQWMAASSPDLISELQQCWDRHWKDDGNVMLLLCGSCMGFMEGEVLGSKSPLFGRPTAQIHLQPFGYQEAAQFHPRWSTMDRARAYFLVGGMPQYLLCLDNTRSIDQNIRRHLLDEFSPLFREPTSLLREELREVAPYHAILFGIASGCSAVREIATAAGIQERNMHYYLEQLVKLGYVRRRYPLVEGRPNVRQVRFAIDDPLLRFWFRFVFPNTSYLRASGVGRAFEDRVRPSLDAWYGHCFERLCREALPFIYADEGVATGFEVGEFWSSDAQIDVVGLREDNWTDLGVCKWGMGRSPAGLEAELGRKMALYPNRRGATLGRRFFVRYTPPARSKADGWYSLEDLYDLAGLDGDR